ncbi:GNAT acetyltransferase-like protein [Paenibacillus taihuensis]|uniref:GNAT acetyltransferase-like protein n=1 Tax=Paenibacillus taihuensis TaxID=1156355 RepID=A0A3D9R1Z9_9BACL|nr:GNAT family N-acetyltransferase [Paenibacillus taihuensis]REE68753.1 GNAT acetyltransferase-like protein [Paenibacillus taihuensis]
MIELREDEFRNILDVLQQPEGIHHVFVYSVIDRKQQGLVYVNNRDTPTAGLVVNKGGCYFVFGEAADDDFNNELIAFLSDPSNHANFFDLYVSSEEWLTLLKRALEGNVVQLTRSHYKLEELSSKAREIQIPAEYQLKAIDEELFNQYRDQIDHSYSHLWGSSESYLKHAFGYCLQQDNEFASVCNTFYIGGGYIAPDIITMNEFRNRGLATVVCAYFLKHSFESGLTPCWDCDAGNDGSNRLAQALGFRHAGNIPILWWHEDKGVIANYLMNYHYV